MITSTDISLWAATHKAQSELPRLVRKLIGQNGTITALAMPAGASVTVGGFDGELFAEGGNAWIPKGKSVWELSVEANPKTKADRDYAKRTEQVSAGNQAKTTYVAITGRKWPGRAAWVAEKRANDEWQDVKAYDADDLENWLEQEASTLVWFAEQVGKPIHSLKSLECYWNDWNRDVVPAIAKHAVLSSRGSETQQLLKLIEDRKDGGTIVLHADSSEEAVAFACAAILTNKDCSCIGSIVIVQDDGWRTIAASSHVHLVVAAGTSIAQNAPKREGLLLLVPVATGDNEAHFPGHRRSDVDADITLQRTLPEDFRSSLQEMGIDEGDAQRLTLQCGRSWSVYRRLKNKNPAQRQPIWSDAKFASVLTTLALIGAFLETNDADQKIVEEISGVPYSEFMNEAEKLIRTDDAPIVRVNHVIKVKAPLELFLINEAGVNAAMLDRFVSCCLRVLEQSDPTFELSKEKRWMANIHGKTRPQSGALIRALADALPKIATQCSDDKWRWKTDQLVRELLTGADGERWLAVSAIAQQLAEASPDEFLKALETDLTHKEPQVFRLFLETSSGGIGGACVYADLLWALETLAWAPNRLLRVSRILAELKNAPNKGNWGNSPESSLLNIYRGWKPQTSATVEMRNRAISALSRSHPNQTFELAMGILHRGHDVASPSSRPSWRDDDAGCPETVTNVDYAEVVKHTTETGFELAGGSVDRATELFERYDIFDKNYRQRVLKALSSALETASPSDVRKTRKALRHKIHWELNYGDKKRQGLSNKDVEAIELLYTESEPSDLAEKHQWLFENYYCELPEKEVRKRSEAAQERVKELRVLALQEIYECDSFCGIEHLAEVSGENNCIGQMLDELKLESKAVIGWMAPRFALDNAPSFMGDWLRSRKDSESDKVLQEFISFGIENLKWSDKEVFNLVRTATCDPITWELVGKLGEEFQEKYWKELHVLPFWLELDAMRRGIKIILSYGNPAAALRSIQHREEDFDGVEVAEIIERNFASSENALSDLQLHDIQDLVDVMENCSKLDRKRLLNLEFQMAAAFGQFAAERMNELKRELIEDPDQMLFVISKAYKPDEGRDEELDEQLQNWARACSHLLLYTSQTPGVERDGSFSEEQFIKYVEHLERRAVEEGYTKAVQLVLGTLLAHSPQTENGDWPPSCVCELLDRPENESMHSTFQTGVYNKRGITSRMPYDGGDQERALAEKYDGYAERCQIEFPLASAALKAIAESYRRDGLRHDRDAESSKERF